MNIFKYSIQNQAFWWSERDPAMTLWHSPIYPWRPLQQEDSYPEYNRTFALSCLPTCPNLPILPGCPHRTAPNGTVVCHSCHQRNGACFAAFTTLLHQSGSLQIHLGRIIGKLAEIFQRQHQYHQSKSCYTCFCEPCGKSFINGLV